jgi:hypothetical protein
MNKVSNIRWLIQFRMSWDYEELIALIKNVVRIYYMSGNPVMSHVDLMTI